jgi:hypothetical protein
MPEVLPWVLEIVGRERQPAIRPGVELGGPWLGSPPSVIRPVKRSTTCSDSCRVPVRLDPLKALRTE